MVVDSSVIAILALLVALVGPLATWRIARSQFAHETELARQARNQGRLEGLYVDVLEYAWLVRDWVSRTKPRMTIGIPLDPPTFPTDETRRRLEARVAAFGSPEAKQGLLDLDRIGMEFQVLVWRLETEEDISGLRQKLDEKREELYVHVNAIGLIANVELRA